MLDKNIVITDQDIRSAVDNLNAVVTHPGIVGYSKYLFSENGIVLRLNTEVDYISSSTEDEAKLANARVSFNAEQAQLKAKYPNLTDEQLEAQLKEDDRAARIAQLTGYGIELAVAEGMVNDEIAQEDNELARAKTEEGFDLDEFKFQKWVMKNNVDVFKEVFIIRGGKKLYIDYTFDQAVVGVGGSAILGTVNEFAPEEEITFDSLKEAFSNYIVDAKFNTGLAFISRISDVNLSVALG